MHSTLSFEQFVALPDEQVAHLLGNQKTCLLGLNGTTRWFFLESPSPPSEQFLKIYTNVTSQRLAEICDMAFRQGIYTLLIPVMNQTLFDGRSATYAQMMLEALPNITGGGVMDDLYARHEVRVGFYGEYEQTLLSTGNGRLLNQFVETEKTTSSNKRHQLLWGVFAQDQTNALIQATLKYYEKHNKQPALQDLIYYYYGFDVPMVDIYITSGKPRLFDAPLVTTGQTDMYFTTAPSLYLTEHQLRKILFDHLFSRNNEKKYSELTREGWEDMKKYYQEHQQIVLGVGAVHPDWGIWYPQNTADSSLI